ncbi:hypothetical protein ATZ36_07655 [Candidatus Endomicrobiellum trichonymphae]|uniref:Peptidase S41 n=1 Tax=Endomicrobium trichonymphae TaxID=1408204 RepID=A0A1E5IGX0_ENDTX|nr:hypothetical protein ATZ36_07655 [Candidatus Endomicrobium trichonymphae]
MQSITCLFAAGFKQRTSVPAEIRMKLRRKIVFTTVFLFLSGVNVFAAGDKTYDKLKLIIDVMELINAKYISETDPENLVIGAIEGIVASQYMEKSI